MVGRKKFNLDNCKLPTVWCGNGDMPASSAYSRYLRPGTPLECQNKGFGAGLKAGQNIPTDSLQNIRYLGPVYENRFKRRKINTLDQLKSRCKKLTMEQIGDLLDGACAKKDGQIDSKVRNMTILWLYMQGIHWVPKCQLIA